MDGRLKKVLFVTLGICGIITLVHLMLPAWGAWRIPLETVLYFGLALVTKALPFSEIMDTAKNMLAARRGRG